MHQEHAALQFGQERIGSMNFRFVVVAQVQSHRRMTATFGQQHGACLRIGPFAVLVATAPKGCRISWGIGHIEQTAIQGHQPIAPIKRAWGLWRTQYVRAVLKEPL